MSQSAAPRKENKMGIMPIPRLVIGMAVPLMLSLLVQSLYNIVDSIFVARIGETALTATSLAYPVQILMIALAVGTGVGINALLSRLLGARQLCEVRQATTTGLLLAVGSSLVFVLLGLFAVPSFVGFMTDNPQTAEYCASYLRICMLLCTGTFLETMAQRFLQAAGNTTLSMLSLIVGAGTNIILDPIMIFGYFGFPALGIRGAAIATVIGQWLGAITALLLNRFFNPEVQPVFRGYRFRLDTVRAIYKVGLPTIIMQAMGSIMNFAMNTILMSHSPTAVAFFGAYYKLQNFLFMPTMGLGQAAIPIIGFNFGAKNGERIRAMLRTALPVAAGIGLIGTVAFMLLPRQLLSLFSASEEMLAIGVPAIRIICVTFAMAAITIILGYSASGLGNGTINMLGTGLRQVILLVPFAALFLNLGGIGMVWYAMWISELCAMLYCIFAVRRELDRKVKPLCNKV